ncbi:MAG: hypothetical protein ACHQK8_03015, partial [Bacteroidia bacterium]
MKLDQLDTLLSSNLGDTLLHSNQFFSRPNNDSITFVVTISRFNQLEDAHTTLSSFVMIILKNQRVFTQINSDTLRKYNLHNYVIRCFKVDKN